MLQVTQAAASVLKSTVQGSDAPEDSGIRFVPRLDKPGALALEISQEPAAGDQVIEEAGIRIFLPEEVADELTDRTLDVDASADGVALTLR